ncbi:unnamed protein product [Acanthosepion pharaonis]|uniref:Uncharacterized protein n=1 Tax=Acanthosepion pharaonis TaxID=158019 RepID=A0A812DPG1_ACAPH|nr:unnamed protein product [Sepia pharaonis]
MTRPHHSIAFSNQRCHHILGRRAEEPDDERRSGISLSDQLAELRRQRARADRLITEASRVNDETDREMYAEALRGWTDYKSIANKAVELALENRNAEASVISLGTANKAAVKVGDMVDDRQAAAKRVEGRERGRRYSLRPIAPHAVHRGRGGLPARHGWRPMDQPHRLAGSEPHLRRAGCGGDRRSGPAGRGGSNDEICGDLVVVVNHMTDNLRTSATLADRSRRAI